jgi:hypothetical protein
MRFQSIPEKQALVTKLTEFFDTCKDGDEVSWMRIEADTAIPMRAGDPGRGLARLALKRARRPYEAIRGVGIRLSSPSNAIAIVRGRFCRIDGAVRIADKTQRELQRRHLDQMTPGDQQRMIVAAGFFGAIRSIAKETSTKLLK